MCFPSTSSSSLSFSPQFDMKQDEHTTFLSFINLFQTYLSSFHTIFSPFLHKRHHFSNIPFQHSVQTTVFNYYHLCFPFEPPFFCTLVLLPFFAFAFAFLFFACAFLMARWFIHSGYCPCSSFMVFLLYLLSTSMVSFSAK